jgi:two-component system LytT family response regulator
MKVVIIDDEFHAREFLKTIINEYCFGIEVVGEADSVDESVRVLESTKPDVVLLDIALQNLSAFDLLERLNAYEFQIIFTTAFDHYALKAIKFSAIDYLIKPIGIAELVQALKKAELSVKSNTRLTKNLVTEVLETMKNISSNHILIPGINSIEVVQLADIIYLEAQKEYTTIYTVQDKQYTACQYIGEFENMLSKKQFFRIHSSFIVQRIFIKRYLKGDNSSVILSNNLEISVSRRRKNEFLLWLSQK